MRWRVCGGVRVTGLAVLGMELSVSTEHRNRRFYGSAWLFSQTVDNCPSYCPCFLHVAGGLLDLAENFLFAHLFCAIWRVDGQYVADFCGLLGAVSAKPRSMPGFLSVHCGVLYGTGFWRSNHIAGHSAFDLLRQLGEREETKMNAKRARKRVIYSTRICDWKQQHNIWGRFHLEAPSYVAAYYGWFLKIIHTWRSDYKYFLYLLTGWECDVKLRLRDEEYKKASSTLSILRR